MAKITPEQLIEVIELRHQVELFQIIKDKTEADLALRKEVLKSTTMGLYIEYGLSSKDRINTATGEIIYEKKEEEEVKNGE